jgi:hypothetical protein
MLIVAVMVGLLMFGQVSNIMIKMIILFVSFMVLISCNNDSFIDGDKYTRSECITKVELFIDKDITKKEWIQINNDFYTASNLIYLNKNKLKILFADISLPLSKKVIDNKLESKYLYAMHDQDCKNKAKNLQIFLEHIKFYVPEFPKYRITNEVVQPSPQTIDANGPYWKDGCEYINGKCLDKIPRDEVYQELKDKELQLQYLNESK